MSALDRFIRWTWDRPWLTWCFHAGIACSLTLAAVLLGAERGLLVGAGAGLMVTAYYAGREHLLEGSRLYGPYTKDRIMDAVAPAAGALLGYGLGSWIR